MIVWVAGVPNGKMMSTGPEPSGIAVPATEMTSSFGKFGTNAVMNEPTASTLIGSRVRPPIPVRSIRSKRIRPAPATQTLLFPPATLSVPVPSTVGPTMRMAPPLPLPSPLAPA